MVHVVLRGHVGHHWRGRGWAPKLMVKGVATPFAAPVTLDVTKAKGHGKDVFENLKHHKAKRNKI